VAFLIVATTPELGAFDTDIARILVAGLLSVIFLISGLITVAAVPGEPFVLEPLAGKPDREVPISLGRWDVRQDGGMGGSETTPGTAATHEQPPPSDRLSSHSVLALLLLVTGLAAASISYVFIVMGVQAEWALSGDARYGLWTAVQAVVPVLAAVATYRLMRPRAQGVLPAAVALWAMSAVAVACFAGVLAIKLT